jgi:hypothetical protein
MTKISIWLSSIDAPELIKIEVLTGTHAAPIKCIRGRGTTRQKSVGSFSWTSAVQALTLLLIKAKVSGRTEDLLVGTAPSPATSLDHALSKQPVWMGDMFGHLPNKRPYISKLILSSNPGGKRPEPVRLGLNQELIAASDIQVFIANSEISDCSIIQAVEDKIEAAWQASGTTTTPSSAVQPLVFGESDLVVIRAVTSSWGLEEALSQNGIPTERLLLDWSDRILTKVDAGEVSIAIYNRMRTETYLAHQVDSRVRILSSIGYSMGGRNFYILAKKAGAWKPGLSLKQFKARIESGLVTVAIPCQSDMFESFLAVIGYSQEEVVNFGCKIIDIPISQGLEAFEFNPDILLVHGQNLRQRALYRETYFELLSHDVLPIELQQLLLARSENCVVCNSEILHAVGEVELLSKITQAISRFHAQVENSDDFARMHSRLSQHINSQGIDDRAEAEFVVSRILQATYINTVETALPKPHCAASNS